ncbi:MAG: nucleotidyl transferase AbiEii/AbiGii toxin family protein [Elusimicrobia bacterium]|nr:nucleotidyl transferase AbiEii/AbiGii toxin family protein [Elusimicrobiota bacterium]
MLTIKKKSPIEPEVLEVLRHIQDATKKMGVSYLVIGGKAIDLLLHNVHGLPTYRPTIDMDFMVALGSWRKFDCLKNLLIKIGKFKADNKKYHRLTYKGKMPIDLLPFGRLEKSSGLISWPPDGDISMNVRGFKDINASAEEIELVKNKMVIRVASLPGLVLLKLLAWNDRFESKDEQDIAILFSKYNMIFKEEHLYKDEELLSVSGFDMEKIGAALLGRDARLILNFKNVNIVKKILNKKEKLLNAIANGLSGLEFDKSFVTAEKLFEAFCKGFFAKHR